MQKMIYDIRTIEYAQRTLVNLTGVPLPTWEQYLCRERDYRYTDDLVEDVVKTHGVLPNNYKDFEFVYFHVTTSANGCASFRRHGLLDLTQAYLCADSELRTFLDKHGIYFDLNEQMLEYRRKQFDISFGRAPRQGTEEYYCWSVGRKFYYDYTTCGFLSVWERNPYGGQVHLRPEILHDIDNLLRLNLSEEWEAEHDAYEVIAKVSGKKIIYDGDDNQSDEEMVLGYLTRAYSTAFGEPTENVLLIKNHVQIPPEDILEIKLLEHWKRNW